MILISSFFNFGLGIGEAYFEENPCLIEDSCIDEYPLSAKLNPENIVEPFNEGMGLGHCAYPSNFFVDSTVENLESEL